MREEQCIDIQKSIQEAMDKLKNVGKFYNLDNQEIEKFIKIIEDLEELKNDFEF